MKKLASLIIVGMLLSGCATPFGTKVGEVFTTGIANPVTTQQIYNLEAAYGVALSGAVAYRERPRCTKTALESVTNLCARRSIVVKLQDADRKAQIALGQLKAFVSANPTLDASALLDAASAAVTTFNQLQTSAL